MKAMRRRRNHGGEGKGDNPVLNPVQGLELLEERRPGGKEGGAIGSWDMDVEPGGGGRPICSDGGSRRAGTPLRVQLVDAPITVDQSSSHLPRYLLSFKQKKKNKRLFFFAVHMARDLDWLTEPVPCNTLSHRCIALFIHQTTCTCMVREGTFFNDRSFFLRLIIKDCMKIAHHKICLLKKTHLIKLGYLVGRLNCSET